MLQYVRDCTKRMDEPCAGDSQFVDDVHTLIQAKVNRFVLVGTEEGEVGIGGSFGDFGEE